MNLSKLLASVAAVLLLLPGTALAGKGNGKPTGKPQTTAAPHVASEPTETAPAAKKNKAYGRVCAGESRKRVAGERGTAFSRCVTAMTRVATTRKSAKAACKGLSKKHVKGTKGTPYSRCIVAAAKLREQLEPTPPTETTQPTEPVSETPYQPAPVQDGPAAPAPVVEPTEPVETTDPVQAPIV